MSRQRVRIRYRKSGDLRLIGHRDLLRTMERLFRRAGLQLKMSEGFHPRPRMTFLAPLALGTSGENELLDIELVETYSAEDLCIRLQRATVPGLDFVEVQPLPEDGPKPKVQAAVYVFPIPPEMISAVEEAVARLNGQEDAIFDRQDGGQTLHVHDYLDHLEVQGETLEFRLKVTNGRDLRPKDVLALLNLAEFEDAYCTLTRKGLILQ